MFLLGIVVGSFSGNKFEERAEKSLGPSAQLLLYYSWVPGIQNIMLVLLQSLLQYQDYAQLHTNRACRHAAGLYGTKCHTGNLRKGAR